MSENRTFDPVWESIYSRGEQLNRYPYDSVVSFVFQHRPRQLEPGQVRVVEVGFGAGNNLWFCAREGFAVAGVDGSASAVDFARQRFAKEGLAGDLRVGDFTELPFANDTFHLGINRAATTQTNFTNASKAIDELHRTLRPGGKLYSEIYSKQSTGTGTAVGDGLLTNVTGRLGRIGQVAFYSQDDIERLFSRGFRIEALNHTERRYQNPDEVIAVWEVVATVEPR